MDKKKLVRKKREKTILISMRIPKSASEFMAKNNYSPTAVMLEALKQIGWNAKKGEELSTKQKPTKTRKKR